MAEDTEYINDLDPILELAATDSFVVETLEGTKRILFKDFILGADNVDFYEEVAANSIAVVALSSEVLNLTSEVDTINSGLTGLSAAYNETIKSGFCYVTIDSTGTLSVKTSSSNISSIYSTDGGSRIQIITSANNNLLFAAINVTLDDSFSASAWTDDFVTYTPVIVDRATNSFKVGLNSITNHFATLTLPTTISAPSETFNPVTSLNSTPGAITPVTSITTTNQSVMLNPSGTGNVIGSLSYTTGSQPVVESVVANTTPKTIVTSVTVSTTNYTIMTSTDNGNGQPLKDVELNISFRYV